MAANKGESSKKQAQWEIEQKRSQKAKKSGKQLSLLFKKEENKVKIDYFR